MHECAGRNDATTMTVAYCAVTVTVGRLLPKLARMRLVSEDIHLATPLVVMVTRDLD